MSVALVWLVAVVTFMVWKMIGDTLELTNVPYYIVWFYAILCSCIVAIVFAKLWSTRWVRFIIVSGIVWSAGLVFFTHLTLLSVPVSWLVWIVCASVQVLVILWYCLSRRKKDI